MTPAQRLAIALAAVHAARPKAIRELTLDDIDLPGRRITLAGHRQPLGDLTRNALLAWLGYGVPPGRTPPTGTCWSRASAPWAPGRSRPTTSTSTSCTASLEQIRRDRILHEALATGADPLHLALVFNIDHSNAMAYANAARNLLSSPAEQALPLPPGRRVDSGHRSPGSAGRPPDHVP